MRTRLLTVLAVVALARASVAFAAPGAPAAPDELLDKTRSMMGHGDYRGALALMEPLTRAAGLTPVQHARLYQQLAAARSQVGEDEQALADSDVADRAARAIDAYDLLARIESVRGAVWFSRGRSLASLRHFQACVDWAQRSKQPALISGAYTRVASAYQDMGDWTRALDAINRAQEAAPHADPATRAQYLTRKGLVEIELHEGALAKASMEEALRLARQMGDRRTESQVLGDLALLHQRVDRDLPRAIENASQSAAIAKDLRLPVLRIAELNELGSLLRDAGRYAEARDRLTEALGIIATANEHRDEPYVLKNLGQTLVALDRASDGERRLREAAAAADHASLTRVRWLARLELAQLHATADPALADAEFAEVLAIVEEQQTNVLLEGFRAGALDQTLAEHDPYDLYVKFLVDRGEPERAFAVAERQRARAFLDNLSGARDALSSSAPPGYAEAESALLRRISADQAALLRASPDASRRAAISSSVDEDERALTALRLRLATERPALAQARYPVPWSLADLQAKLLAPNEVLVAFFLGADRSDAWIVDRDGFGSLVLPARRDIEDQVQAALAELRAPRSRRTAALDALSKALKIDRLSQLPDGTRLIVVPHGVLYDVPFEALTGTDGRRLVERFAISYAPSASSLAFLRSEAPVLHPASTLIAIGNPRGGPGPLPYSAGELHAIAGLFGRPVHVLEGDQATEGRVRDQVAGGARMLHFATHGMIDELRPDRSGLVLTANPPADDGLLQMREVYAMRMDADLVTLSACETALGRNVMGEGVIGLARAFFYAGARSVVASLWDVDDRSTARLMQRFYEHLRAGQPIDVALQQAKLSMIRDGGQSAAPFYWAAFIASGRTTAALELPPLTWRERMLAPWRLAAAAAAALVVSASCAIWWWMRRRSRGVSEAVV